ncbi:GNAT family N-acetyltransferase [Microcella flavibacter]|uniref:GNAT family N-acetyltransferase n=1 Tax=Microcella flavibacter TaxID=1804990 RepID=UPI0014574691|nr:GNAT family N-acetyltransferase [Microcella flavibacter]
MTVRYSTDPADVDLALAHHWLSEDAYWALGRSRELQDRAFANSIPLVAVEEPDGAGSDGTADGDGEAGGMVAIARLVTDRATFAWLCDVYVRPDARGRGIGSGLARFAAEQVRALGVKRTMLATADAHGVYAGVGFEPLHTPGRWMILPGPGA